MNKAFLLNLCLCIYMGGIMFAWWSLREPDLHKKIRVLYEGRVASKIYPYLYRPYIWAGGE